MMLRVAYIAWDGPIPARCPGVAIRLEVAELFLRSFRGYSAVVFSARAVEEGDPHQVMRALTSRQSHAVICLATCDGTRLASWMLVGFRDVVSTTALAAWLQDCRPGRQRHRLSPAGWLDNPPAPGTEAHLAASAIDEVPIAFVKPWVRKFGRSRRRLNEICKAELGGTPDALRRRYLLFAAAAATERSMTREKQAEALGYTSAATLCRALARARVRWPDVTIGTRDKRRSAIDRTAASRRIHRSKSSSVREWAARPT